MMRAAFRAAPCAENAEVSTSTMLFKTISASVYGIDAYLVEVEVGARELTPCCLLH